MSLKIAEQCVFKKKQMNERQFCILTASSGPVAKSSSSLDIEETNFPWKMKEKKFILVVVRNLVFDENRDLVRARVLTVLHQIFKTWFKILLQILFPFEIWDCDQVWAEAVAHWLSSSLDFSSRGHGFRSLRVSAHSQMYDVQILNY